MTSKPELQILGLTDVGISRDHNEDTIGWQVNLGLAVLADGMGGHNAGEVASDIAVHAILDTIASQSDEGVLAQDPVAACHEAVKVANETIFLNAKQEAAHSGMGTTIVVAVFQDGQVTIAHVGDSRLYRYREAQLQQLTHDHSLVQEMVRNGYMTEEEALTSNNKNMITRALGVENDVTIDVQQQDTQSDDLYLLCSDGLSDLVTDTEIGDIVAAGEDMQQTAQNLIDAANGNGGMDNISVVLVKL